MCQAFFFWIARQMKSTSTEPEVEMPMLWRLTPSIDVPSKREERKFPNMLPRMPRMMGCTGIKSELKVTMFSSNCLVE